MSDDIIVIALIVAIVVGLIATAALEWRYVRRHGWRRHLGVTLFLLAIPLGLFVFSFVIAADLSPYILGFAAFVYAVIVYLPASVVAIVAGVRTQTRPLLWFSATALVALVSVAAALVLGIIG